jgi:hypothetical protein
MLWQTLAAVPEIFTLVAWKALVVTGVFSVGFLLTAPFGK